MCCIFLSCRSKIRQEFLRFDEDGSGFITQDELLQVVQTRSKVDVSEEQIAQMLKDSDENSDGKINYEEFVILMTK